MFSIDPGSLRSSGDNLAAVGEQFQAAIEQFQAQIAAYGAPWGDDEIGLLVGLSFPVVGDYVLECCLAVADEYQLSGDDLVEMADETEQVDADIAARLDQLSA